MVNFLVTKPNSFRPPPPPPPSFRREFFYRLLVARFTSSYTQCHFPFLQNYCPENFPTLISSIKKKRKKKERKKEEGIVRRWHCVCALEEHITTQPRFQDPISYFGHRNEVDLFRLKKNISVTSGSDITKGKTAPHYLHFKEFELD